MSKSSQTQQCCAYETFLQSFLEGWQKMAWLDVIPAPMLTYARNYWETGMMGHEALACLKRDMRAGRFLGKL